MTLYEKYRPRTWSEVVGQSKAIQTVLALKSLPGESFFISGKSGNGKTTIARLIAAEVAEQWETVEVDASDVTLDLIREWEYNWNYRGMGKGGKAYIVNEVHSMRAASVSRLCTAIEKAPEWVSFIFTTTCDGLDLFEDHIDAHPFLSRCHVISLAQRDVTLPMAERLQWIAQQENLDGQPVDAYVALLRRKDVGNNMRKAIQLIAEGVMLQ